ncbi:hypothetical protein BH11VER1_BH11VER1_36220 [soil metagenome]
MAKKSKTSKPATLSHKRSAAEAKFAEDLTVRGEAVPPSNEAVLPSGATHLIVTEDGVKKVKRVRFSSR